MKGFFKFGDHYIKEVIKPLIPNANLGWFIGNQYYLSGPGIFENSQFERKLDTEAYFYHFTSISSLLEIIRSGKVRMSDFNSFSDEYELTLANNNLVDESSNFTDFKSCLFALSMCEESDENLRNEFLWKNYGDNNKGVCIRLKINKSRSSLLNFYLTKIIYSDNNRISELEEVKKRHERFKRKYGYAIDNLDEILLIVCSMYKKESPYKDENETRLLAYISKNKNETHTNCSYPIRHRYNSKKDLIEYFLELELEYENSKDSLYHLPYISIENVIFGRDINIDRLGRLLPIIEYEFWDSFKRKLYYNVIG